MSAIKHDEYKPRIDLIPPEFITDLADVYTVGAQIYGDRNWEKGMAYGRVYAAAMRHMLAFWSGEDTDGETGLPHLLQAAWGMATLHHYMVYRVGTDDRPRPAGHVRDDALASVERALEAMQAAPPVVRANPVELADDEPMDLPTFLSRQAPVDDTSTN